MSVSPCGTKYRAIPPSGPLRAVVRMLAVCAVLASCAPPDRPDALPPGLPDSALRFLEPDVEWSAAVAPGVSYRFARAPRGPWGVHLLRVDLTRCELGFAVLPGEEAPVRAQEGPRARVSELAGAGSPGVIAAVNGDFFTPEGRPLGVEITRGEVRSRSNRASFAWHPGSGPWFGTPVAQADSVLVLGWTLPLGRRDGRTEAIAGFPALLTGGEPVGDLEVAARPGFAAERHPRTAVAWDPVARVAWLVVVEGRMSESAGMSLPELTELLVALGASEALNLDGGGSSAMVIHGKLVSRTSDAAGERPVANALGLRRDAAFCTSPSAPAAPTDAGVRRPVGSVAP
jgi:hypothetical protein